MPYYNNKNYNILFIHIPKTGGTSVEVYFNNKIKYTHYEKTPPSNHLTIRGILKYNYFYKICFKDLNIITVVRNPYERAISDLYYLKLIKKEYSKDEVYKILKKHLSNVDDNMDYHNAYYDNHTLPQYLFVTNNDKKLIPNLKILKTETLSEDMKKIGFDDFNIKINENPNKLNYYEYLNEDSICLINTIYYLDFELFGYQKI